MKNIENTEVPQAYINRSPVLLAISTLLSIILLYVNYTLFKTVNPIGFIFLIPSCAISIHTLWLLLNPFASIFKDNFEIRLSLFHTKQLYYIDIHKIGFNKRNQLIVVYHDDESEHISLFGIQKKQVHLLKETIEKHISETRLKI